MPSYRDDTDTSTTTTATRIDFQPAYAKAVVDPHLGCVDYGEAVLDDLGPWPR